MRIKKDISLIDYIAECMGCEYISDLNFLDNNKKTHLYKVIKNINYDDHTLFNWSDAAEYITKEKNKYSDKEEAKNSILKFLKK